MWAQIAQCELVDVFVVVLSKVSGLVEERRKKESEVFVQVRAFAPRSYI